MASVIEAYNSTIKEAYTGLKILLWAIPIAYVLSPENNGNMVAQIVMGLLLFSFILTLARNVMAKKQTIVPGINFFDMLVNGALGLIAILPTAILGWILFNSFYNFIQIPDFVWNTTALIIVGLFAISLPITSLTLLVRRMNILDAFNIKSFFCSIGEVFLSFSFFTIRAGLLISIVIGFLYYLFNLFIGFSNSFWTYIMACTTIFSLILIGNTIAQISDEVAEMERDKQARKIK